MGLGPAPARCSAAHSHRVPHVHTPATLTLSRNSSAADSGPILASPAVARLTTLTEPRHNVRKQVSRPSRVHSTSHSANNALPLNSRFPTLERRSAIHRTNHLTAPVGYRRCKLERTRPSHSVAPRTRLELAASAAVSGRLTRLDAPSAQRGRLHQRTSTKRNAGNEKRSGRSRSFLHFPRSFYRSFMAFQLPTAPPILPTAPTDV